MTTAKITEIENLRFLLAAEKVARAKDMHAVMTDRLNAMGAEFNAEIAKLNDAYGEGGKYVVSDIVSGVATLVPKPAEEKTADATNGAATQAAS